MLWIVFWYVYVCVCMNESESVIGVISFLSNKKIKYNERNHPAAFFKINGRLDEGVAFVSFLSLSALIHSLVGLI